MRLRILNSAAELESKVYEQRDLERMTRKGMSSLSLNGSRLVGQHRDTLEMSTHTSVNDALLRLDQRFKTRAGVPGSTPRRVRIKDIPTRTR